MLVGVLAVEPERLWGLATRISLLGAPLLLSAGAAAAALRLELEGTFAGVVQLVAEVRSI